MIGSALTSLRRMKAVDAVKATVVIAAASHLATVQPVVASAVTAPMATASLVMLANAATAHASNGLSGIVRTVVTGPPAHPLEIARLAPASAVIAPMATASLVMLENAANGPSGIVQTVVTGQRVHHLEIARPAAASAANDLSATASLAKVQTAHAASVHSVTNLVVPSPSATSLAKVDLLAASRVVLLASPHSASRAASVPRVAILARVPVAKAQIVGAQTTRVRVMVPVAEAPVENLLVAGE